VPLVVGKPSLVIGKTWQNEVCLEVGYTRYNYPQIAIYVNGAKMMRIYRHCGLFPKFSAWKDENGNGTRSKNSIDLSD